MISHVVSFHYDKVRVLRGVIVDKRQENSTYLAETSMVVEVDLDKYNSPLPTLLVSTQHSISFNLCMLKVWALCASIASLVCAEHNISNDPLTRDLVEYLYQNDKHYRLVLNFALFFSHQRRSFRINFLPSNHITYFRLREMESTHLALLGAVLADLYEGAIAFVELY